MERLYTIDQLAEYLQVKKSTIRDWCHTGFVPFVKVGRLVRFREGDILKWLSKEASKEGGAES